jgi:very-short-patch-repair endonuclease
VRRLAGRATAHSDSGTESLLKLELLRLGIPFIQQALIDGVGAVDFLIGERLVIEVDSRAHHSDPYRDRRRDAELGIRGYRVLRFMYSQIVYEWPVVEAAILAAMLRADHHPA